MTTNQTNNGLNVADDFEIIEALLITERAGGLTYDVSRIITDFEIYEHIDKPFLTARIAMIDGNSIMEASDIQGGEKIRIRFQSVETKKESTSIVKTFIIDKVIKTTRANERTDVVYFSCYEDVMLKSSLINVNKHYKGNMGGIVSKILFEHLNKSTIVSNDLFQSDIQLIVPNMHPIEAASWVKNRITSKDGFPFYLYKTLNSDDFHLIDLGTLIKREPINKRAPFLYSRGAAQASLEQRHLIIKHYKHENTDDIMTLVRKGYVGATYNFIDTLKGINRKVDFDVASDVFYNIADKDYLGTSPRFNYAPDQKMDDIKLSSYRSTNYSVITGNGAHTYDNYSIKSLDEEDYQSSYKKRIVSHALKNFMTKTPISVVVPGRPFMRGDGDYTIGNVVRLIFLESTNDDQNEKRIDTKKSGDYVLYSTKHSFSVASPNRIDSTLLCAKLSSFDVGVSIGDLLNVS